MNLVTLFHSSSKLAIDFLQRLSKNGLRFRAYTIWYMATSGLKFLMLTAIFPKRSMKVCSKSTFIYLMLTGEIEVKWFDMFVENYALNLSTRVSKQSINWVGVA